MNDIARQISRIGIVPVIAIDRAEDAVALAQALRDGGLPAAEVTFRTPAAAEAISAISTACADVIVGAGTVLNLEQCDRALAAGARFIVSPGYNPELVEHCQQRQIPVFPGCVNASDMTRAVNAGLEIVKFFPAEPSGGVAFLKALAPVFPSLKFMPTGGVNINNLGDYFGFSRIVACGGTWMVKKDLLEARQWATVTQLCRDAVSKMLNLRLAHVDIRCQTQAQAADTANVIGALFGADCRPGASGILVGSDATQDGPGPCSKITFTTANVDRAIYHLGRRGVRFDEGSRALDPDGNTKAIQLDGEICGFAIHLVQK